jgi:flagellar hook-length control protein FliK
MTGPGVVMPQAPSLASPPAAKIANPAHAREIDNAELGGFSDLLGALKAEADAPGDPEQEADAQRDESAGPSLMPIPMPMFPEKTPQTRFAEELNAALSPEFAQTNLTSGARAAEAEAPAKAEAANTVSPAAAPVGGTPAQPPMGSGAVAAVFSSIPGAVPETLPAGLSALPAGAPANPLRSPRERNAAKDEGSAISQPTGTLMAGTDPLAAPAETTPSGDRSSRDGEREDTARTLAALKDAKVSVVHQETHFAPALPQSPAFQIANRIIHDVETADPAFMAQPAALPKDASAGPLKVLELQLDPPELGALMIRLSLKDNALHMQIEASHHETARLIERDREALTGMLRSAGYGIDGLSVQITTGDRGNGAQQFSGGGGFNQSAGQHSAGRQPEGSGSGQAWQRALAPERIAENGRETEPSGAPGRRGGPVYL